MKLLEEAKTAETVKTKELVENALKISQLMMASADARASTSSDSSSRKFNSNVRAPEALNFTSGDMSENFKVFKAMFDFLQ